ncbi:ArnT family glycosyltransferase [Candidatus Electronema sp. TJ]|uniref:ArnT family glycosyltransferase n=1 Tax=Candidatus Electronema sp. TJ TaxID=3401573 RepID=UPI003AA8E3B0
MNLSEKIKSANPVYLFVSLFFLFKLHHIHHPYFWDELGVYSRAALYMFDHQLSMMPNAIPPELSRGHPLLCSVIFAVGYKIFGPHVWAGHLVALLFSCGLLLALYRLGRDFFGHTVGLLACALLAAQPVFIAQSSMVLPEIMLAFFCTASIHAYLKERLLQTAIFSTLAIMTKETAVALPASFGLHILLVLMIRQRKIDRGILYKIGLISAPLLAWGIFLAVQKLQNGWFFFPLHSDYVSFSIADIYPRLFYYLSFLFKGQGRYLWSAVIIFSAAIFIIRNAGKMKKYSVSQMTEQQSNILLLVIYITVSLAVSSLNFHLARYVLIIMPVIACLVAAQFFYFVQQTKRSAQWIMMPLLIIPFLYYKSKVFNIDADMSYADIAAAQQEIIAALNEHAAPDTAVGAAFPVYHGLLDKRAGYSTFAYKKVVGCGDKEARYVIFSSLDDCRKDSRGMTLLQERKNAVSMTQLYKRNN